MQQDAAQCDERAARAPRGWPRTPPACALFFSPGHHVKSRADKGPPWNSLAKIPWLPHHPNNSNSAAETAWKNVLQRQRSF
eukprot:scaffold78026_cov69-Phaeocystis_antarctica.AAC.1